MSSGTFSLIAAISMHSLIVTASSADLIGQASVNDGDTLEIHGARIRLWGIDAPKAASFAGVRTACNIGAARKRPMIWMHSLRGGQ